MTVTSFTRCRISILPALCLVFAAVFFTACSADQPNSETVAQPGAAIDIDTYPNPTWFVAPSLDEQIFDTLNNDSLVIVRASLLSATAGTEEVPGSEGIETAYRPVHELRFTAHEYLEGNGPTEFLVVVRGDEMFSLEHQALTVANYAAAQRTTSWDNRQAVLFIGLAKATDSGGASGVSEESSPRRAAFLRSNPQESAWDYTVDHLSRSWLPAQAEASGAAGSTADSAFITDGAQSPPPTISLADLKAKIATMKAELKAGEGIPGFEECISGRILQERIDRAEPLEPLELSKSLGSGMTVGTEVDSSENNYREPEYNNYWLSGPSASLFQAVNVDNDDSSVNGYTYMLSTARPLPAGSYRVHYIFQHYTDIPCSFKPDDVYLDWTITVTSPTGTLHEAFFDPVDLTGGGIGASGSSGVIDPDELTVGNDDYEIESIVWDEDDDEVVLTLDDHVSLSGKTLDFIELDGSIDTSLNGSDATVDQTAATWTWSLTSAPWEDGDTLMLRIREAPEDLGPLTKPTNIQVVSNAAGELTVTWEGSDNATSFILIIERTGGESIPQAEIDNGKARSFTFTGLTPGTYLVYVIAQQTIGDSYLDLHDVSDTVTVA